MKAHSIRILGSNSRVLQSGLFLGRIDLLFSNNSSGEHTPPVPSLFKKLVPEMADTVAGVSPFGTLMPNLNKLRHHAYIQQSGHCYYCGCPMWEDSPEPVAKLLGVKVSQLRSLKCTAEHMIAKIDGGANTPENIVAACQKCNHTRHKLKSPPTPDKYRQHVQRRIAKGKWHEFSIAQRITFS